MVTDLQLALACAAAYYSPPQSYARFAEIGYSGPVRHVEIGTDAALIGTIEGHTVIAFRGTLTRSTGSIGSVIQDWLNDLDDTLVSIQPDGGCMHRGFWNAVSRLMPEIGDVKEPVICTGHSKGGAMALIAARGTGARAVTFASARAGDADWVDMYRESVTAYEHADDIVPHLPPSAEIGWLLRAMGHQVKPRYRTTGRVRFLDWSGAIVDKSLWTRCQQVASFAFLLWSRQGQEIIAAHSMEGAYIRKLEGQVQGIMRPTFRQGVTSVTAAMVLIAVATWARPHADNIVQDHRLFLRRTGDVLERQTEIQAAGVKTLEHLERKAERSEELLRDIHGHLIRKEQGPRIGQMLIQNGNNPAEDR